MLPSWPSLAAAAASDERCKHALCLFERKPDMVTPDMVTARILRLIRPRCMLPEEVGRLIMGALGPAGA